MKAHENLIIATICFGIILLEFVFFNDVILHPYMGALIFTMFGVGGYHAGLGIGKVLKESRNDE